MVLSKGRVGPLPYISQYFLRLGTTIQAARKEWKENELGIELATRHGPAGNIFSRRSWARKSESKILRWLTDIGFADGCVVCARNPDDLQSMLDIFNPIITSFGQEISVPKTKIIDICASATADSISESEQPLVSVSIDGQVVKVEKEFKYLGSFESNRGDMDKEVRRVIQSMNGAFER